MIDNGILLRVARALEAISRTMTEEQTERKLISMESKDPLYATCWQIIKWEPRSGRQHQGRGGVAQGLPRRFANGSPTTPNSSWWTSNSSS